MQKLPNQKFLEIDRKKLPSITAGKNQATPKECSRPENEARKRKKGRKNERVKPQPKEGKGKGRRLGNQSAQSRTGGRCSAQSKANRSEKQGDKHILNKQAQSLTMGHEISMPVRREEE